MAVNFWSTKKLIEICVPIMQRDGRVVVVSSMISQKTLYNTKNQELLEELSPNNIHLTLDRLEFLAKQFLEDFPKSGKGAIEWPKSSYGISKQLLNCLVRIISKVTFFLDGPKLSASIARSPFQVSSCGFFQPTKEGTEKKMYGTDF